MAIPYQSNLNVNSNEVENIVIQNLSTAPTNPKSGQMYYNTTQSVLYWYNGTTWIALNTPNKADRLTVTSKRDLDALSLRSGIYKLNSDTDITILDETSNKWTVIVGEYSTSNSGVQIWMPQQYGTNTLPKMFIRRAISSTQWSNFAKLYTSNDITSTDLTNIKHNKGYYATLSELQAIGNGTNGDFAIVGEKEVIYIWNSTKTSWIPVTPEGVVTSVNGRNGDITLSKSDVGLGNVNNTADSEKPVSTPQQQALDTKVSKSGDTMTGELKIAAAPTTGGQIRLYNGSTKYGSIIRNDGNSTYILLTNANDVTGTWNSLRPFSINNLNGLVTIGNGLRSSSTTDSTSTTTGGLISSGGLGVAKAINAGTTINAGSDIKTGSGKVNLKDKVYIQYNSDTDTLDFIFS